MNYSASKIRVKEKIRYDVDAHRQKNKQILLNSRRGVKVEKEDKELTTEDLQNMALGIKRGKKITVKQLKLLQNAFLDYLDFTVLFYNTPGAVDSLLHLASSKLIILIITLIYLVVYIYLVLLYLIIGKNEELQLAAIECFVNMGLGEKKICFKLTKLIAPYLMMYINHLNFNISVSL